jgi:DNA-directed RNA polymerase subunit RPC12/RpoP
MTDPNHYNMSFICANCGHKFEKQIRKGTPANGQAGICPNCGVRDNVSGVGQHRVIRDNESADPTGGRQVLLEGRHF